MTFLIAIALFLGGMYMFTLAFSVEAFQALIFLAGILMVSLSVALPVHILKAR